MAQKPGGGLKWDADAGYYERAGEADVHFDPEYGFDIGKLHNLLGWLAGR